jgi:hypothetical protein
MVMDGSQGGVTVSGSSPLAFDPTPNPIEVTTHKPAEQEKCLLDPTSPSTFINRDEGAVYFALSRDRVDFFVPEGHDPEPKASSSLSSSPGLRRPFFATDGRCCFGQRATIT